MRTINLTVILIGLFILISCSENIEQSYINYNDFINSSLGSQTWFPSIVKSDCYNFKEVHNLDLNSSFGKFSYYDTIFYDSIFTDTINFKQKNFIDFQKISNKINRPNIPDWFIKLDSSNMKKEVIIFKNFYITREKLNKTIFFISEPY